MSAVPHDVETGTAPLEVDLPPDPEIGKGFLKPIPETTTLEKVAGGAAVASVVTALAAMIIEGSAIVLIGGILSAVVGPYAYWQQVQLTDIKALQETQEKIQYEVDRLVAENNRLAKSIDELSDTVQGLKDIEDSLELITKKQGQSVETLARQVETSRKQLQKQQGLVTSQVLSNLLSLVRGADTSMDGIIDAHEVDALIGRINTMAGVRVKEDLFRAAVVGKPPSAIGNMIVNLAQGNKIPEEERIFIIN